MTDDTSNRDSDRILALNEMTGLVHDYRGTAPGGLSINDESIIGISPCGCAEFAEAVEHDTLTVIHPRHLEDGIWEPAPCLDDDEEVDIDG